MISRSLTIEIYRELCRGDRFTAAGMCHALRDMELPPVFEEAERSLEWLTQNGYAKVAAEGPCGTEYTADQDRRPAAWKAYSS